MELFDLVLDYLTDQEDAVKRLITLFLNQVMEVELEQQVGASNYERTDNRVAHRNGKRPRTLKTRYGDLELLKPEIREKPFETVIFDKYSRVERALEAAIVESYIQGVSTRRISSIIEALGLKGISPDTVSSMSKDLDNEVQAFLNRPIECLIPYLIVDAVYIKCRDGGRVVSKAVLIIAGDAGRGFAVVADEVKALAVESQQSAEKISSIIQTLQKQSENAAGAMNRSSTEVSDGNKAVNATFHVFSDIVTHIQEISENTSAVASAAEEQAAAVQEITASVHELETQVTKTAEEAVSSTAATEETSAALDQISQSVFEVGAATDLINHEMGKFVIS